MGRGTGFMKIIVTNDQRVKVDIKKIKYLVEYTLYREGAKQKNIEVGVLIVGNKAIKGFNKQYLKRNTVTDVISFRMWEGMSRSFSPELLGDIVVNAERAKEIAKNFEEELYLYVVHGVLHLLGYVDDTKKHASQMQRRCEDILRRFLC
jgi:probable rRNA maturation factor